MTAMPTLWAESAARWRAMFPSSTAVCPQFRRTVCEVLITGENDMPDIAQQESDAPCAIILR
jgi:hypothetical protein